MDLIVEKMLDGMYVVCGILVTVYAVALLVTILSGSRGDDDSSHDE